MEHRASPRKTISQYVLVYQNNLPVLRGTARNISLEGLFLETGPVIFKKDTLLEVEFHLGTGAMRKHYRVPVVVRRKTKTGLGMVFKNIETESVRRIQEFLYRDEQVSSPLMIG